MVTYRAFSSWTQTELTLSVYYWTPTSLNHNGLNFEHFQCYYFQHSALEYGDDVLRHFAFSRQPNKNDKGILFHLLIALMSSLFSYSGRQYGTILSLNKMNLRKHSSSKQLNTRRKCAFKKQKLVLKSYVQ